METERPPRHLHIVPSGESEAPAKTHLEQIVEKVDALYLSTPFSDDDPKRVIHGRIVDADESEEPDPVHRFNVHLYNRDMQHGPAPKRVALFTSHLMEPNSPLHRYLLTYTPATDEYNVYSVDTRLVCGPQVLEALAHWLNNFEPINTKEKHK